MKHNKTPGGTPLGVISALVADARTPGQPGIPEQAVKAPVPTPPPRSMSIIVTVLTFVGLLSLYLGLLAMTGGLHDYRSPDDDRPMAQSQAPLNIVTSR
jgi:hypothetical protein